MEQEFIDYELHLQMFIDAGADEHARCEVGEPTKPEGYDEYKALQNPDNQIISKKSNEFDYVEFINKLEIAEKEKETNTEQGLLFDEDGIPQYLNADDHYNKIENPEWTKKHKKSEITPYIPKEENIKVEKEEEVYNRYSGLEKYLSESDYEKGIINPEWEKEHGK